MADRIRKVNVDTGTVHLVISGDKFPAASNINGIEVSNNGTLYAADIVENVVYKIFEDGQIHGVLVGKIGVAGDVEQSGVQSVQAYAAGTAGPARLDAPSNIAIDASDNIYITDLSNYKVKRISSSGRCKVLAGSTVGDTCSENGTAAKFTAIRGIAVDKSGNLYVCDFIRNKIKKVLQNGAVRALAGSASGTAGLANGQGMVARFSTPRDICADASGNLYVADSGNNCIRRITQSGDVTILAGSATGAQGYVNSDNGLSARFDNPCRISMDPSGQFLYVLDYGNMVIRKVWTSGKTTTVMALVNNDLNYAGDIAVDKSGVLYVLEKIA